MPVNIECLSDALRIHAQQRGQSPAILAPGRLPLNYEKLFDHAVETIRTLNAMGIGRNHRVAIVAPSSPETGVISAIVQTGMTCINFNPGSSLVEFMTLMKRLQVVAVIITEGLDTAAWQAAQDLGLHIIVLTPLLDKEAGLFSLVSTSPDQIPIAPDSSNGGFSQLDDIAKLLLTSGTTDVPKIVPYTVQSLSVQLNINGDSLALTPQDCLLSILPMFHGAGISYVLQSLTFGASTVILPGFEVKSFFQGLREFRPTWVMAVATMYQTILDHAREYPDVLENPSLRCIAAVSMALDSDRSAEIEQLFKAPVIQIYGTTEAGLISCNPLPPRQRKLGSGGLPVQSEIRMIDDNGQFLPTGDLGEIVVRSPSIMPGYYDDPQATAQVFINGWYRTGDVGYFDDDGYLFIVGRIKEVVNRGGQKVSPAEVEKALLTHPQVTEAAVFAIPDTRLGEEIGAAVILRTPDSITETVLQTFIASVLAPYKVPRHIAFVTELPKNAMGKVQRVGLAQKLGLTVVPEFREFVEPRTPLEEQLAQLWIDVLGCDPSKVGIHTPFADLGGGSLSAARLIFKAREVFKIPITILDFFNAPTIADQAAIVNALRQNPKRSNETNYLIPIQPKGTLPPLYCFPPLQGAVYVYQRFIPFLKAEQPMYGLLAVGIDDGCDPYTDIEQMAQHYYHQITAVQRRGPYYLCGYSFGGRVALETARKLREDGHTDTYVLIIDDALQTNALYISSPSKAKSILERLESVRFAFVELNPPYRWLYTRQRILHYWRWLTEHENDTRVNMLEAMSADLPPSIRQLEAATLIAAKRYIPQRYTGDVCYLFGLDNEVNIPLFKTLRQIGIQPSDVRSIKGGHFTLLDPSNVASVGAEVQRWLTEKQGLSKVDLAPAGGADRHAFKS